ncbi:aminotransferase class I/II-fold pyridoxal phosphate-dependent enzyme [Streptomyces sp. NPDC047081]|uniref:aminotransferase class I/II-fold pyridoxal phosphate-dependent enzyme n=1 Tax=Streptomyces sp. NPDC047081 TaxID=3154706 RepID=UPI0033F4B858
MSGLRIIMDDIAALTSQSSHGWLNLGIGNPAPLPEVTTFWQRHVRQALDADFEGLSCSYGPSRGLPVLLDAVVEYFNRRLGWSIDTSNVLVGPGSQMLCFIAGALYTGQSVAGERSLVLPALPDYTGYEASSLHKSLVGIPSDVVYTGAHRFRYELDRSAVEQTKGVGVFLVSNPSNPTGRSLTQAELDAIVKVAGGQNALTIVDNAYGEPFPGIAVTHTPPPQDESVLNCFSFSKAGLPGERLGIAIGPGEVIKDMVAFLGNTVLHAPRLAQYAVAQALKSGDELGELVAETIQPFYTARWNLATGLFREHFPPHTRWFLHEGTRGMFSWLHIDELWFDDLRLYALMKEQHTFVVPGSYFFAGSTSPLTVEHGRRCVRISLSAKEADLRQGIARLAIALKVMAS